ncbi:pilus assembly protein PilP [Marinimicrobium sp. ABcell2]|uniref:pilus assembly protein PilP n=1 Tax=Marinimicrobium sp. ABcell2 TaxID=3069751 RepID=UPI0027B31415|nr:pilus assembly protein PilP [Marinimicrobium sp. ABcell2]MDQ2076513.1 pilus assembly protein PilP [Marinimicrobium sp. ABcell2]
MKRNLTIISLVCSLALLVGCGGTNQHRDLQQYIEDTKNRPEGEIEPLPAFRPYRPFTYGAMTLRSPFDPPMREEERSARLSGVKVQPDLDREREYLENFNVASLAMVGTLTRDGRLWVLVDDGQGGVHPVTVGNYLGKNHGRIVAADRNQVELMEIVSDGGGGWVERPRIIELRING